MLEKFLFRFVAPLVAVALLTTTSRAVTIDYVPVGDPGNINDTHGDGYGGVADPYLIGKYEVTNAQYIEFLSAVATVGDPNGLYNTDMAGTYGGIDRTGLGTAGNPWVYSAKGGDGNWLNRPVNHVSWYDTLRFSNWLHNGQLTGAQDASTTENGAYEMSLGDGVVRKPGARVFLPTDDEWYKAAYYDDAGSVYYDYPTGTDTDPSNVLSNPASDPGNNANFYGVAFTIGSPYYSTEVGDFENSASPYGTFDQGGNVREWTETADILSRMLRGGDWNSLFIDLHVSLPTYSSPTNEGDYTGFRVASSEAIPEPGSITLLVCGLVAGLIWWRRRR